ncbi:VOC family protein [Cellulomonas hominis]
MTETRPPLPSAVVATSIDARHWRVVLRQVRAVFRTAGLAQGADFVARVAAVADALGHHPDVVLRARSVLVVSTTSHEAEGRDGGGLTAADVAFAAGISALADELGLSAVPGAAQAVEVAVDALDIPAVRPFWAAVLGYEEVDGALVDPVGTGAPFWFQQTDAPRTQRGRIHVDVSVGEAEAPGRIAAALAAGGHLVTDVHAPAWWVLADAEGNEACVSTWQGRPSS